MGGVFLHGTPGWVAVTEWLARPPAKQEVCGSNPASYLF